MQISGALQSVFKDCFSAAPANLACIRRIALTQFKQETSKKLGSQGKRRRAGWDQVYMEIVLKMGSI